MEQTPSHAYKPPTLADDIVGTDLMKTIDEVSVGFQGTIFPTLELISAQLSEIKQSQNLIKQVLAEQNQDWRKMPHLEEIEKTFSKIPLYIAKTKDTQREMYAVQERIDKLKKRSEKLLVQ
ncbi:biogenesis of lysosome-related organelles complex 1 subunit 6 [Acrasis kona]|uniref:Biogenesis of lysosome-related organelles complex 1 subunit 6 n=1 Tax=Acrasis kona TaxID=1008807 RepID=A0AAW2ZEB5_9EUKA